jgi:hypothetical protein
MNNWQPFLGAWPLFHFHKAIHHRQVSLEGGELFHTSPNISKYFILNQQFVSLVLHTERKL